MLILLGTCSFNQSKGSLDSAKFQQETGNTPIVCRHWHKIVFTVILVVNWNEFLPAHTMCASFRYDCSDQAHNSIQRIHQIKYSCEKYAPFTITIIHVLRIGTQIGRIWQHASTTGTTTLTTKPNPLLQI
jgi:hypothetical protein